MKRLVTVIAFLCAFASSAYAIDFSVVVTDLKNEVMVTKDAAGKDVQITLGQLCTNALLASYEDERNLPATEKVMRFKLAMKLNDANGNPAKDVSLSSTETALITKLAAKLYSPLALGKILQIIDPEALK